MKISSITNPEAKRFINVFLKNRNINREFYKRVPEDKLDYRMTSKSDSIRESIVHQIYVTRKYIYGVKTEELKFDGIIDKELPNPDKMTKQELLTELSETQKELVEILSHPDIGNKKVKVSWSKEPVPAIASLWGMDSHEVLHTGWNLAVMDHLNMERFAELKQTWG